MTDERLFAAVRKAVELKLLPEYVSNEEYVANVERIRLVLEAADAITTPEAPE